MLLRLGNTIGVVAGFQSFSPRTDRPVFSNEDYLADLLVEAGVTTQ